MSNSADVAQLYKNVIEEVIRTVRTDFVNMGVDEQVLVDLQTMWEQKLVEARVFDAQDFPLTTSKDYAQQAGFFYPPGMRPPGYVGPGTTLPPNHSQVVNQQISFPGYYTSSSRGQPAIPATQPTIIPPPVQPQNSHSSQTVEEVTNDEVPQFDGASDMLPILTNEIIFDFTTNNIPQFDGVGEASSSNQSSSTKRPKLSDSPQSEDELGSDLDDDDETILDDENVNDLILCQYEKISRVRTRWRGVLRAGIVHVNKADFCFSRSNMDFDW